MRSSLIALLAAGIMLSSCLGEGKQIRPEAAFSAYQTNLQPKSPEPPAIVDPWQADSPLGWEGSIPTAARESKGRLRSWIASIKSKGNNTLLVQRYLGEGRGEHDIPWKNLVAEAHQQQVRVYAVVNLREALLGRESRGWSDIRLHSDSGVLRPSGFPDLLHPGFQQSMRMASLELVAAGVDLIVLRFDPSSGPYDGFSQRGLDGFHRDFRHRLSPMTLFTAIGPQWTQGSPEAVPVSQVRKGFAPEFWRWAGWKNREYLNVLNRMMAEVKRQQPGAKFGIELHPDTMANARRALGQYTEDFLEARQRMFDRFIVVADAERGRYGMAGSSIGQAAVQMTELLDDPSRVFVLVSGPRPMWSTADEALNLKSSLGLQQGVGFGFRRVLENDF